MTFTETWPEDLIIVSFDTACHDAEQIAQELQAWDILSDEALVRAMLQASRIYASGSTGE